MTTEENVVTEEISPEAAAPQVKKNKLVLQGKIVSNKMQKTIVVEVEYIKKHRLYKKPMRRHAKFKAHDEDNLGKIGDIVRIEESRPYSKEKTWRLVEIVTRGNVI